MGCLPCLIALTLLLAPAAHASSSVNSISAGVGTTCALTDTSGVECWGWNFYGTLGMGALDGPQNCYTVDNPVGCSIVPVAVRGLGSGVRALASGYAHACALTDAGGVECWGYNTAGQLGDGTNTGPQLCSSEHPTPCSSIPVAVSGLGSGVSAIGSGWDQTCAVMDSGAVECWGNNGDGQLGNGTTVDSSTPVAVQLPEGVKATAVAGGNQHMCALTDAGGVECWGYNGWGLLGIGTETGPQTCGENPCSTTPVAVHLPEGVTATAIASGGYHTCVVTSTGGVMCWGRGEEGELGNGSDTESWTPVPVQLPEGVTVKAIASESYHTCALTSTGSVLCWGYNGNAQLGDGTFSGPETCAEEGSCSTVPVAVSGLEGAASAIATGGEYGCAVGETGGGVQCWGYDGTGGLGIGNTPFSLTPAPVLELMSSLSVSVTGAGSGTVYSSKAGIECGVPAPTSCTALFAPSSTVTLHTAAASGSAFVGFTGSGCGGTTCTVPMSEAHSVAATFALAPLASISGPLQGGTYTAGEAVPTSFSCAEGSSGPGLSSCEDSGGAGGGTGVLDTSTAGAHTYTVTATSKDGAKSSTSIGYTVVAAPGSPPPETTPGPIVPGLPGPTPVPVPPAPKVSLEAVLAPVVHGHTGMRISCHGGSAGGTCRGTVVLSARRRVAKRVHGRRRFTYETIVLARAGYNVRSAGRQTVVLWLTNPGIRLLNGARHHRVQVRATVTLDGGRAVSHTLTLRG